MIEIVILSILGVLLTASIPLCVRFEHRITIIEGKLNQILNHNGFNKTEEI